MQTDELFIGTNYDDPEEREQALDSAEESFAEMCYVEESLPDPEEFVASWSKGFPELGEPEMPKSVKEELLRRCLFATLRIAARDSSYEYFRNIYTEEDREAARERRRKSKEIARRWMRSNFEDLDALRELGEVQEAIEAERRPA